LRVVYFWNQIAATTELFTVTSQKWLFAERFLHQMKICGLESVSCQITRLRFRHGTQTCCHRLWRTWIQVASIFCRFTLLRLGIAFNLKFHIFLNYALFIK